MSPTSQTRSIASKSDTLLTELIDEVSARLEAGEAVDLDAFIAAHPERAEKLRLVLPALAVLADLGRSGANRADVDPLFPQSDADSLGELGDYRILREIGRGGMGVVYEATQISLNRRVALKVLPFAGALDTQHLARFRLEAQAAAQLHHTNIVPVFAVGTERGVHYYAMQFIEGKTLAALIRELREHSGLPARGVKELADDDAAAPSLATDLVSGRLAPPEPLPSPLAAEGGPQGQPIVVADRYHRLPSPLAGEGGPKGRMRGPIAAGAGKTAPGPTRAKQRAASRPSNTSPTRDRAFFRTVANLGLQAAEALEHAHRFGILHRDIKPANLLVDVHGNLWVTDFGLARFGDDASLTMTGDLLGTLRYMSPEQALGHPAVIDQRSDVYGLGVTLYELIALQPAFYGRDRQEILRRIAFDEPPPPRKLNPPAPRELETIVLKAMSKEPAGRYATAQELADELRRFLEHKPIKARRPSFRDRVVKFARRHPSMITSVLVALALLVAGLGASTALIQHQRDEARRQARRADRRSEQARRAVDTMYTRFAQNWLANQPRLQPAQREFLVEALQFYEEFAGEEGRDRASQRLVGQALLRVAEIHRDLGELAAAQEAGQGARRIFASLTSGDTSAPEDLRMLAQTEEIRGQIANHMGQVEVEREAYLRAVQIGRSLAGRHPRDVDDHLALARALYLTHDFASTDEAVVKLRELHSREPQRADYRWELSNALAFLGTLSFDRRDLKKSEQLHIEALWLRQTLVDQFPDEYRYLRRVIVSLGDRGRDLHMLGRLPEAEKVYQEGLALSKRIARDFPSFPENRSNVAVDLCCVGSVIRDQGRLAEAEPFYVQAIAIAQELIVEHPELPKYQALSANYHSELGRLLEMSGRHSEALRAYRQALHALESLAPRLSNALENRAERAETTARIAHVLATARERDLHDAATALRLASKAVDLYPKDAQNWNTLGIARYRAGDWNAAIEALNKSAELGGGGPADWLFLSMSHWMLGRKDQSHIWYTRAVDRMKEKNMQDVEILSFRDEASALLGLTDHLLSSAGRKASIPQRSSP